MNGYEAPRYPSVPMQRDAPARSVPRANPAPATAARDGHHDWGAVVAVLAALITLVALAGPGESVTDYDGTASVGISR